MVTKIIRGFLGQSQQIGKNIGSQWIVRTFVEDDNIRLFLSGQLQGFLFFSRLGDHLQSGPVFQQQFHTAACDGVVIDEQ